MLRDACEFVWHSHVIKPKLGIQDQLDQGCNHDLAPKTYWSFEMRLLRMLHKTMPNWLTLTARKWIPMASGYRGSTSRSQLAKRSWRDLRSRNMV